MSGNIGRISIKQLLALGRFPGSCVPRKCSLNLQRTWHFISLDIPANLRTLELRMFNCLLGIGHECPENLDFSDGNPNSLGRWSFCIIFGCNSLAPSSILISNQAWKVQIETLDYPAKCTGVRACEGTARCIFEQAACQVCLTLTMLIENIHLQCMQVVKDLLFELGRAWQARIWASHMIKCTRKTK